MTDTIKVIKQIDRSSTNQTVWVETDAGTEFFARAVLVGSRWEVTLTVETATATAHVADTFATYQGVTGDRLLPAVVERVENHLFAIAGE